MFPDGEAPEGNYDSVGFLDSSNTGDWTERETMQHGTIKRANKKDLFVGFTIPSPLFTTFNYVKFEATVYYSEFVTSMADTVARIDNSQTTIDVVECLENKWCHIVHYAPMQSAAFDLKLITAREDAVHSVKFDTLSAQAVNVNNKALLTQCSHYLKNEIPRMALKSGTKEFAVDYLFSFPSSSNCVNPTRCELKATDKSAVPGLSTTQTAHDKFTLTTDASLLPSGPTEVKFFCNWGGILIESSTFKVDNCENFSWPSDGFTGF